MKGVPIDTWLKLWDDVLRREWQSDDGLGKKLGLASGTVHNWRHRRVVAVNPYHVKRIEDTLGYKIALDGGEWTINKLGEAVTEPPPTYRARMKDMCDRIAKESEADQDTILDIVSAYLNRRKS